MKTSGGLNSFFNPQGIAVIGASQDSTKLGYGLARNLIFSNYQGTVHLVNPHGGSLFGRPVYQQVGEVPDPLDLALLLIPARAAPQTLGECGERGVEAVVIGAGGFRETGPEGLALELECLEIARKYGMRIIGPNSIGLLDTHLPVDATFLPPPGPLPGEVAFISQSGAICAAVIDWGRGQGLGLSRLVSLGNQVDVSESEVLAPVAADPFTRVLTLYLEGVSHGRQFVAQAEEVSRKKPIIALKVGRFSAGQRAAASHTGAMAGSENAYQAAFRRAGVIRAETSQELFDWARALAWCPLPAGGRSAVLTNAGGPGVTAADALELNGLQLAKISQECRDELEALLPPAASLKNPIDILASASPELYASCLRILLADSHIDSVLVILPPPPMYATGAVAKALIPVIHSSTKPVVIALMGERLIQEAVEHFRAGRVPEYRFPEQAAAALGVLTRRSAYLAQCAGEEQAETQTLNGIDPELASSLLAAFPGQAGAVLPADLAQGLIAAYGIQLPPSELARSPQEAALAARRIGFPVALKIASPDISHKSDVNGILLNRQNEAQVEQGYREVIANARAARPEARLQGVTIQAMLAPGQELIVGALQDPQFGALAMFGSGGIEVEGLKDVSFRLAPLTPREADEMIAETWAGRKLDGYRGLPPADHRAVHAALLGVARLAADFPQLGEIEINPLRVMPGEGGAFALDIRIILS